MYEGRRHSSRERERERGGDNRGYRDRGRDYDRDYDYDGGGGYDGGRHRGHRFDDRYDDYHRRSRKDSPPAPLRNLNYDDENEDYHDGPSRGARSSERHGHPHENWRDRDFSRVRGRDGSQDSDTHRRYHDGSEKTIVLNYLPHHITERDILLGFDLATRDPNFCSDQVKSVRRSTDTKGHACAYVEFKRRSDAVYFLDEFQNGITFPLQDSRPDDSEMVTLTTQPSRHMRYQYCSGKSRRRKQSSWECVNCGEINHPHRSICFECKDERAYMDDGNHHDDNNYYAPSGPILTGETDECPQQRPSQYVVIRGLDRSVSEEVFAKGVMKLFVESTAPPKESGPTPTNKLKSTAPSNSTVGLGAKPGSLRRVFLMRGRATLESWGYGFAEFATVEDAIGAVAKFRASTKFTISSKPVFIAFIHTGVFVPAAPNERPDFCFTPIYNPALRLKYWDDRAFPSIYDVTTDPVPDVPSPEKGGNDDPNKSGPKGFTKWKKDKEMPDSLPKIAMIPQMQLWAKASAQLHGGKPNPDAQGPAASGDSIPMVAPLEAEDLQPDGPYAPHLTDQYISYADWDSMSCVVCSWKAPTDQRIKEHDLPYARSDLLILHEGKAHQFYRDAQVKEQAATALAALDKEPRTIIRRAPRLKSEALPVYKSYADFDHLYCVLCKRKFERIETLWLHEQQSELHKRMLEDVENCERAEHVLEKLGKKQHSCVPTVAFYDDWEAQLKRSQGAAYRDRALERRQAYKQPKKPSGQPSAANSSSAVGEKRKELSSATDKDDQEPVAKKNKGMNMLAKMGWTAGAGLGADGAGRTEAIAAEVYAPGVGLGVEGGKLGDAHEEANRKTKGDQSGFVEKTKDRARERFERME